MSRYTNWLRRAKEKMKAEDKMANSITQPGFAGVEMTADGARNMTASEIMRRQMANTAQAQYDSQVAARAEAYFSRGVKPAPKKLINTMSVEYLDNGLVMTIDFPSGNTRRVFVESIENLGDALIAEVVANRITGEGAK